LIAFAISAALAFYGSFAVMFIFYKSVQAAFRKYSEWIEEQRRFAINSKLEEEDRDLNSTAKSRENLLTSI